MDFIYLSRFACSLKISILFKGPEVGVAMW